MKKISNLLNGLDLKPQSYRKVGNVYIVGSENAKYVIKKNDHPIYDHLNQRNFNYYPKTIIKDGYEIAVYEEESEEKPEEKMNNLITLAALLHTQTTYYKTVNEYDYQEIYEKINDKINDVKKHYHLLADKIESEIFMSPSSYLLIRHITQIFNAINYCEYNLKEWFKKVKEKKKIRQAIIHNKLSLDHYINNKLISWDQAKFSSPVFDIYKLYQNTYNNFVWDELFKEYNNNYPLKEEEQDLFFILISIPKELNFTDREYDNTNKVNQLLEYIDLTGSFIENLKKTS